MRAYLVIPTALVVLSSVLPADATEPGVRDCLSATETSLKLRTSHKLRAARAQLLICSAATCPAVVRAECVRRMGDFERSGADRRLRGDRWGGLPVSAVKVTMDGEVVANELDGSALSLDPGRHQFTFEVAGQPPLTKTIILYEGEKNRRESLVIGSPPTPPVLPTPPAETRSTPMAGSDATAMPSKETGHAQRVAGVVVGAGGLAGIVAGGIFGAFTYSAWSDANSGCPTHSGCSAAAIQSHDSAVTEATVSTVAFIAGGVLLAGGLTLFFTAPKDSVRKVGVQVAPGWLGMTGRFE